MKNIPQIILKEDIVLEDEVSLFLAFLHHPYYVQNKNSIFRAFPNLKQLLQETQIEKKTIQLFIQKFLKENKNVIHKAIQRNKDILNQYGDEALIALSDIMEYHHSKQVVYTAIPTILPFSPFKDNIFYFSILGEIRGNTDKNILKIGIHEISHFIFLDLLQKLEDKKNLILEKDAKNYLKEALAVVVLNREPLRNILKLNNYKGNPEIQNLKIQETKNVVMTFTDFLEEYYRNIKIKQHQSFGFFLEKVVDIVLSITPDLIDRRLLWNQYGKEIFTKLEVLQIYSKPIKIKKE